jgi:7,8-didemethyl-8-hydroxy-5-deazariboflavin synthase CofG subunit
MTKEELYALINCPSEELGALLDLAAMTRQEGKGRTVSYSRKIFLPITNLCRDRCSYCTFRKDPDDPEAWTMTPDEINEVLIRGRDKGCKEALMWLGHRTTIEYVVRACEIAIQRGFLPHTNAGLLSKEEMQMLQPVNASLGLMLESASARLTQRGMPHFSAPDKKPDARLQMIREAGELWIAFTTGILIGIGETREERVDSLLAIRDLHEQYGHIQEIIIQNFRAKPGTRMEGFAELDGTEIARTVAVARVIFGPDMNIQVPPHLTPRDHALLLMAGINDWGGISPVTLDYVNPEAAWPNLDDLAKTCAARGFTLRERLCIYDDFVDRGFLPVGLMPLATYYDVQLANQNV